MLRQEMGKDEVKIDTLMLIELVHWYLTSLKGAVYSTWYGFLSRVACFWSCSCSQKDEILD